MLALLLTQRASIMLSAASSSSSSSSACVGRRLLQRACSCSIQQQVRQQVRLLATGGTTTSATTNDQQPRCAVGIDLGTTQSCVAVLENGVPAVIADENGNRTTPSVVAFNEDGRLLVGHAAKRQQGINPTGTFSAVKRLIGRRYTDPQVSVIQDQSSYEIVSAENGDAWLKLPHSTAGKSAVSPVEVLSTCSRCVHVCCMHVCVFDGTSLTKYGWTCHAPSPYSACLADWRACGGANETSGRAALEPRHQGSGDHCSRVLQRQPAPSNKERWTAGR